MYNNDLYFGYVESDIFQTEKKELKILLADRELNKGDYKFPCNFITAVFDEKT